MEVIAIAAGPLNLDIVPTPLAEPEAVPVADPPPATRVTIPVYKRCIPQTHI